METRFVDAVRDSLHIRSTVHTNLFFGVHYRYGPFQCSIERILMSKRFLIAHFWFLVVVAAAVIVLDLHLDVVHISGVFFMTANCGGGRCNLLRQH